jgi:hypothetical protein
MRYSHFDQVEPKYQWFEDRKAYVDALEAQFKAWHKSIETVVKQRKGRLSLISFSVDKHRPS